MAGNSVFQRVSQYSWEELLERPHNVIRHPDMPRGVFWLLWDRIRSGMPIGAYVKNRSKNGGYYWVYAIVTPVEGGYLSVRLKPTSALLSVVEAEYGKLRDAEAAQKLSPADSAQLLLTRLPELGYRDYVTFMGGALTREILER
ncbi:MAG: PAS domain-containing protein, partial [Thermomonas sp.]